MWRMKFLHPAMWHDHDIDFAWWLHHAMWHVALESWQWIQQVAAPSNVIRVSWITCYWIHPGMWHVALRSWQWIRQVAVPCNVAGDSGMTCHGIRSNVRHIGILHLVSILTISPQSTCHSAPVREIFIQIGPSSAKRWRLVDFQDGGSPPSWISGSNNGFFEKRMYDFP